MAMRLSATEREIMDVIWAKNGPVTSRDMGVLSESRGWKAPTVLSFLKRLCDKGFLHSKKSGKLRIYTPAVSQEAYVKQETDELIAELYHGRVSDLIASLTQQGALSQSDRAELKKLLDEEWT